jgi:ribonuclease P protein component
LIVSRKVGNAVARNRVKRAIREWFRSTGTRQAESADIVVIARRGAAGRLASEICHELSSLMTKLPAAAKSGARK